MSRDVSKRCHEPCAKDMGRMGAIDNSERREGEQLAREDEMGGREEWRRFICRSGRTRTRRFIRIFREEECRIVFILFPFF